VFKINYKIQEKSRYFTRNQRVSRYPERWQAKSSQHILRHFVTGRWAIIPFNRSRIAWTIDTLSTWRRSHLTKSEGFRPYYYKAYIGSHRQKLKLRYSHVFADFFGALIGFSKPGASHPVPPRCFQRLGHFAPLSFTAYGGKIQATRFAGGRW